MKLQTEFKNREDLASYLRDTFPDAAARSPEIAELRGGRSAAEALLQTIEPRRYATTRNHLNGAVSRLSAYLRHGVLTLAEVRRAALHRSGRQAEKTAIRPATTFPGNGWRAPFPSSRIFSIEITSNNSRTACIAGIARSLNAAVPLKEPTRTCRRGSFPREKNHE